MGENLFTLSGPAEPSVELGRLEEGSVGEGESSSGVEFSGC